MPRIVENGERKAVVLSDEEARKLQELEERIKSHSGNYTEQKIAEVQRDLLLGDSDEALRKAANTEWIAARHFLPLIRDAIKAGANVNAEDENGVTPLMCVEIGEQAKLLIEAGANVNAKSEDTQEFGEKTPLRQAVEVGNISLAEVLIKAGANVNETTWRREPVSLLPGLGGVAFEKQTPLMYVENLRIAKLLIEAGADVNAWSCSEGNSNFHMTPLMYAAARGNPKLVRLLIESGAKVNMLNRSDLRATSFAKNIDVMIELVLAGASSPVHSWETGQKEMYQKALLEVEKMKARKAIEEEARRAVEEEQRQAREMGRKECVKKFFDILASYADQEKEPAFVEFLQGYKRDKNGLASWFDTYSKRLNSQQEKDLAAKIHEAWDIVSNNSAIKESADYKEAVSLLGDIDYLEPLWNKRNLIQSEEKAAKILNLINDTLSMNSQNYYAVQKMLFKALSTEHVSDNVQNEIALNILSCDKWLRDNDIDLVLHALKKDAENISKAITYCENAGKFEAVEKILEYVGEDPKNYVPKVFGGQQYYSAELNKAYKQYGGDRIKEDVNKDLQMMRNTVSQLNSFMEQLKEKIQNLKKDVENINDSAELLRSQVFATRDLNRKVWFPDKSVTESVEDMTGGYKINGRVADHNHDLYSKYSEDLPAYSSVLELFAKIREFYRLIENMRSLTYWLKSDIEQVEESLRYDDDNNKGVQKVVPLGTPGRFRLDRVIKERKAEVEAFKEGIKNKQDLIENISRAIKELEDKSNELQKGENLPQYIKRNIREDF